MILALVEVVRSIRSVMGNDLKDIKISKVWDFGDDKSLADNLKRLVIIGKKQATTGIYTDKEKLSKVGDYEIILDHNKNPFCIIECIKVEIKDFLDVDYEYIKKEGEDDKDINEWRDKHRTFFSLKNDNTKVVCIEFKLVKIIK